MAQFFIISLQEVVTVTVSIVRNGEKLIPANIIGMFICLGGITAHVFRKASQLPDISTDKSKTRRGGSNYAVLSLSSCSESDSDDGALLTKMSRSEPSKSSATNGADPNSQPLLWGEDESELSSDEDCFQLHTLNTKHSAVIGRVHNTQGKVQSKTWNSVGDDFFLRDNRTWTGVRDAHIQMRHDNVDAATDNKEGNDNQENDKNVTILVNTEYSE